MNKLSIKTQALRFYEVTEIVFLTKSQVLPA